MKKFLPPTSTTEAAYHSKPDRNGEGDYVYFCTYGDQRQGRLEIRQDRSAGKNIQREGCSDDYLDATDGS